MFVQAAGLWLCLFVGARPARPAALKVVKGLDCCCRVHRPNEQEDRDAIISPGREAAGIVGPSWEEGTTRKHVRSDLRFVAEFSGVSRVSVDDPDDTNGI